MNKKCIFVLAVIALFLVFCGSAAAETQSLEKGLNFDSIYKNVPQNAKQQVEKENLNTPKGLLSYLSPSGILDMLTGNAISSFKKAMGDFALIMTILLIIFVVSTFKDWLSSSAVLPAFNLMSVLTVTLAVFGLLQKAYSNAFRSVSELAIFQTSTIAVIGGAMAAGGAGVSASVLPAGVLMVINLVVRLNTTVFLPIINFYFALTLAESLYGRADISGITKFVKSLVTWGLGFATTVLIGVLNVQKSLTGAADTAANDAAKFAVGSFLPVVGGVIKDAVSTVAGSIGVIKTTAGTFGIVIVLLTLLPPLINCAVYSLMFKLCTGLSAFAGEAKVTGLLKNISGAWDILLAILVCEGVFSVVSLSILINSGVIVR
ncbi:MAG: hypothetical protein Q8865_05645 [Bacillota bacterium]|nr:hypothetical protein [Bacillota bacterium]